MNRWPYSSLVSCTGDFTDAELQLGQGGNLGYHVSDPDFLCECERCESLRGVHAIDCQCRLCGELDF